MAGLITRGFAEVLDVQEKVSKKNKTYKIAVLGDKDSYFQGEFFVSDSCDLTGVVLNQRCEVSLMHEKRGYDISTVLVGVKPVK